MWTSLKNKAKDLGFISLGISRPIRPLYFDSFQRWISEHKHADMRWLEKSIEKREDPSKLLKGCSAVISLAFPYSSEKPQTPDGFCAARYSSPQQEDYHRRLKKLCYELTEIITEAYAGSRFKVCVDSSPIMEKTLAISAGIGFMGKNTLLIIPGYGSYFFLAEILTTAPMEVQAQKPVGNLCGDCTRCIDACPTGALRGPFILDASRCLSYLSIEHEGKIRTDVARKMGRCFFGCDRCQEACPFNNGKTGADVSLPSTEEILGMDDKAFQRRFGNTALARAGLEKIKSNLEAVKHCS